MAQGYFSPKLFRFFQELGINNERAWFDENRARYEAEVKGPLLQFIADFAPKLKKISKHFIADPRPNGGSLFRIHRDTRFAKDKSPYKTHAAAQFRHERGKDVHAPGFYLHLGPGEVFAGAGLWHPEPEVLAKVRQAIVASPAKWKTAVKKCSLSGEALSRPPRGFDPEHPLIEDLKRKDFVTLVQFSEKAACAADFLDRFTAACRETSPLMSFLTRALDLEF